MSPPPPSSRARSCPTRPGGDAALGERPARGGGGGAPPPPAARFAGAGGRAEPPAATAEIAEICHGEHPYFRTPTLEDRGAPAGIDVRRVVETGITPLINTGIAGRTAGTGQIGAGVVRAPLACFAQALEAVGGAPPRRT